MGSVRPTASSQWRVSWVTRSAVLDQRDLAGRLEVDRPRDRAQRVEVLDLAAGAELARPARPDRHVGVHPHRSLLHAAVGGAGGDEDRAQLGRVGAGAGGGADVGLAHDLDQRDAGPVVVDERVLGRADASAAADVRGLARVLFDVGPGDADPLAVGELQEAADVDRLVVLADLVVLGHVGIEVVLAVEGRRPDLAVQGGPDPHGQLDRLPVEHRQRPRQPEADRAHVRVGLVAERVLAPAEQLGDRQQLAVDLEADHHLPAGHPRRRRVTVAPPLRAPPPCAAAPPRPGPARAPGRRPGGRRHRCRRGR